MMTDTNRFSRAGLAHAMADLIRERTGENWIMTHSPRRMPGNEPDLFPYTIEPAPAALTNKD